MPRAQAGRPQTCDLRLRARRRLWDLFGVYLTSPRRTEIRQLAAVEVKQGGVRAGLLH